MLCPLAISFLIWISVSDGLLFKPRSKCVPTAAAQGPCHDCVCSTHGVYHCWHKKCDNNETKTTEYDKECEPSLTYIERGMTCSCNIRGDWRSSNCRNRFRRFQTKNTLTKQMLRTNIGCIPHKLYLIDCNICRCEPDGILKASSCTNRPCAAPHKAETCRPGDIERFGNELCVCSDINYFIDRLCFAVKEKEIQIVENTDLEKLVYADQPWRRTFVENYRCKQNITFTMDCNTCACKKEVLECTNKVCKTNKDIARSKKKRVKILPELKSADQRCKPGKKYKLKCNTCVCADDGLPTCTNMVCLEEFLLDLGSLRGALKTTVEKPNLSNIARTLPEIHEAEKCTPGHKYKMDCNTCFCKDNGSLMCTKVLCLSQKDSRRKNDEKDEAVILNNVTETAPVKEKKKKLYHIPKLPKKCVPGKVYKKACHLCFCEDNRKAVCTRKKNACKPLRKGYSRIHYLEDIRPPFQPREVENLPELPQRQVNCRPGKSYKVDCNGCVCLSSHNLICDELICLSYDDMHRIEADEKPKANCKPETYNKTTDSCVECDCVKDKLKCNEIVDCVSENDKKLSNWNGGKPKLTLDMFKETCLPGGVYRMDCNNCYCQEDKTLRCTQKTCLNYSQSKALEKQRTYLIKHGL